MRERTTWNRDSIKQASSRRLAEDPRAMNQDHLSQQPKADKYVTGDPSTFAEDVHTPNSWDVEYSGGATKRDEIGMPEKRPETYNHPEKTASMDEATLLKKAALCARVARLMLKGRRFASEVAMEAAIEDQSVALMHMPNTELVATAERLASEDEFPGGEFPTAGQKAEEPAQAPAQGQQAQQKADEPAQAPQQGQQAQQKGDEPPAQAPQQQQAAPQQNLEAQVKQMVEQAMKQQMAAQPQVAPAAQPQVPPAGQTQPMPTAQDPMGPMSMDPEPTADDMLLDEMLAPEGDMGMSDMGIEMEAPTMDVGDVVLAHEDEVLKTLFANEESDAQQAQQAQQGGEQQAEQGQKQAGVRTASTRTVGTRPTQGVSKVGGSPSGRSGGDVDKLAALWPSAPDVRDAFNMK